MSPMNPDASRPNERIEAAPEKAATSLQGLTKSTSAPAKTREVSMATPKDRPRPPKCRECGGVCRIGDICHLCRTENFDRALPAGRWVGGLVKTFIPSVSDDEPFEPRPTLGATCHCGCLLADAEEECPACTAWATRNAIEASWTYTYRRAA